MQRQLLLRDFSKNRNRDLQPLFHGRAGILRSDNVSRRKFHAAKIFSEIDDIRVGILSSQGGACQNILNAAAADPGPQTTHEHGCFHACCSFVNMGFVQNDKVKFGAGKYRIIFRAKEHIFQHRIVCDQDVRRCFLHLFPGKDLVGKRFWKFCIDTIFAILLMSFAFLIFCVAVIKPKSDIFITPQQPTHSLNLVVCQRIHRVNNNRPNSFCGQCPGFFLL